MGKELYLYFENSILLSSNADASLKTKFFFSALLLRASEVDFISVVSTKPFWSFVFYKIDYLSLQSCIFKTAFNHTELAAHENLSLIDKLKNNKTFLLKTFYYQYIALKLERRDRVVDLASALQLLG